ncbi:MAG: hypothetical protein IM638_12725 [Bacteroidetes bacterium]|nr:hypothetical protein [Bacteroidota bacterium]
MQTRLLFLLCLFLAGTILQAQNTTTPPVNPDSLKNAILQQSDSSVNAKLNPIISQLQKTTQSINRLGNYIAPGLDAGTLLTSVWLDSSKNTEVIEVFNTGSRLSPAERKQGGLQSFVSVRLNQRAEWLRDPKWRKDLCLVINGMPLPEVRPLFFNNDSIFTFYLERGDSSTNQIAWDIIQQIIDYKITRDVKLSIGTPVLPALPVRNTDSTGFTFIIIYKIGLIAFGIVAVAMIVLLFRFRKSQLFRTSAVDETGKLTEGMYSLAKVQLAFWTVIIILCETYIWCITGALPDLSASSLVLLGISVGTTALSNAVGYANELKPQPTTGSFWRDIITDSAGVPSIHRMQMVIWTILIGFYFVRESWLHFSMPNVSENMLILMGISSGTYVAFKTQEPKGKATPANPAAPANPQDVNVNDDEPAAG